MRAFIINQSVILVALTIFCASTQATPAHYQQGVYQLANKNYHQAIKHFSRDIADNPKNAYAYFFRGVANFHNADKWHELKNFSHAYPMQDYELTDLFYKIETKQLEQHLQTQKEYQELQIFYSAYRVTQNDFSKALRLNRKNIMLLLNEFIAQNSLYVKIKHLALDD